MNILISICLQGIIYGILALGLYITFRVLNFADMTAEGSLALGGSVCAVLIINGVNPILSIFLASLSGSIAGLVTGILNTKLKIQGIFSGILTMIALYSVNLRIMGKANLSLLGENTIFKFIEDSFIFKGNSRIIIFLVCLIICILLILVLNLFFRTRLGLAIKATGDNEQMAKSQGVNTNLKKVLALMIGNSFCAISGALIAQNQGYADINMGTGTLVIALSSIVIGEAIVRRNVFLLKLMSVILGSICYRFIIFIVLSMGMNPSDLKLFTAVVAACLLFLTNVKENFMRGVFDVKD